MGRVLYGVHGTGHGHAMRGLTIARKLKQHEFLFVANDDALHVLEPEFNVFHLPNLGTVFKNYRIDFAATISKAIPLLFERKKYLKQLLDVIDKFKPDVCMTDLEYFVPYAAKIAHLPCLTLDHQHIITCCQHNLPPNFWFDTFIQGLTPRYLFAPTEANLLISFYAPPILPKYHARIAPPILRDRVLQAKSSDAGHILVYQSNSTSPALLEFLQRATKRTCYIFGYAQTSGSLANLRFCAKSEEGFLRLLESCAYVIQGGSHTLMSEALYLGKPILSLPLGAMLEQRFNALYLERLGYGKAALMHNLHEELLQQFEANLDHYRQTISATNFCGNDLVFSLVDKFITSGKLTITAP
ncbi:MAG: teichoic acid biosynthesis protein [Desulfovibrionaceae bacterium]|nr:teichoic acid biosynthesis protein [Desulfovibrionaceae bacterium]